MPMRESMRFDEWQNSFPGNVPGFGAIFMSNTATKKECLQRKLFGLQASQAYFVKQVKAGMILFLFDFERRQLHGVYQACSDGAMNIVPNAFLSSGRQFPAQVEFTPFWECSPLSEDEFGDAIKENYFSAKKFNFGLSEDQVRRLLSLFSLRKLRNHPHERLLTRTEVAKPTGYSVGEVRKAADGGRLLMTDRVERESNADNRRGSVLPPKYPEDSFGNSGRLTCDGRFSTNTGVGNLHNDNNKFGLFISNEYGGDSLDKTGRVPNDSAGRERNMNFEHRPSISTLNPVYYSGSSRKSSDDVRFATSDRLEFEYNDENGIMPVFSPVRLGSFRPKLSPSDYPCKPILEADSSVQDQHGSYSTSRCLREPWIYDPSRSISYGDTFVTTTLCYDPDVPTMNYRSSPSLGINQRSAPPQDSYAGTCSSFENQSLNDFSLPYPKNHKYSYKSGIPLMGAAYSEFMGRIASENEGYQSHSVSKPSFNHVSFLESVRNGTSQDPPSYSISPSKCPSSGFNYVYHAASRDMPDYEMRQSEINKSFPANVPMFGGVQSQLQGFASPIESYCVDHHEDTSLNPDVWHHPDGMHSGSRNRNSVFSRLAMPSEMHEESDTPVGNSEFGMDASVDEIMGLLHKSHYNWVKMRRFKPVIKRYNAAAVPNFRNKKETTFKSPAVTLKDMHMNGGPAGVEIDSKMVEEGTPFVDFKRRSKLRKIHSDTMTSISNENPECDESSPGSQRKKRKLIRPSFRKDVPPEDNVVTFNTPQSVQVAYLVSSVNEDSSGSCEVLVRSQDNNYRVCKNVELPHLKCQIICENKNDDAQRGLICDGEEKAETCEASLRNADDDGKISLENSGNNNVPFPISSKEAKALMTIKDSGVHALPQDCNNASQNNMKECSSEIHGGNAVNENANGETKCGDDDKMLQRDKNVGRLCPIDSEIAISDPIKCSSNQTSESDSAPSELVDICVKRDGKERQLSLEPGSKQCKASFEMNSCFNMQESSQAIYDGNSGQGEILVKTKEGKDCEIQYVNEIAKGEIKCGCDVKMLEIAENVAVSCPIDGEIAITDPMNCSSNQIF